MLKIFALLVLTSACATVPHDPPPADGWECLLDGEQDVVCLARDITPCGVNLWSCLDNQNHNNLQYLCETSVYCMPLF